MTQCILCQHLVLAARPELTGRCWKDKKRVNVLDERKCEAYRLGTMDQIRVRGVRFEDGKVLLK